VVSGSGDGFDHLQGSSLSAFDAGSALLCRAIKAICL
jgi:hypothetical protein